MKVHQAFNHHLFPGGGKSKLCKVESAHLQNGGLSCSVVERDEV